MEENKRTTKEKKENCNCKFLAIVTLTINGLNYLIKKHRVTE